MHQPVTGAVNSPRRRPRMLAPNEPSASGETARLAALRRYEILDTQPEPGFDDLTRLAARVCHTPIAVICFVDEERQWFKSRVGLDITETPRNESLCTHAMEGSELMQVTNTSSDKRFAHLPLVNAAAAWRFYAGMPLITADGHKLGTLCVVDHVERELDDGQRETLRILAHQVVAQLEVRRHTVELERALSEQRRVRDALQASEFFYESLVQSLPEFIIRKDRIGRFTFANRNFCQMLGLSLGQIIGRTDADVFPPHLAAKYHQDDLRVMDSREKVDTVEANQTEDGTIRFVHVIKTPLEDTEGRVVGIQGIFWDVTERRRIEDQLAYERDLLRALLENIPDRVFFKDAACRFLRISNSMARRLGLSTPEEAIGRTDEDYYPPAFARQAMGDDQWIVASGAGLINKEECLQDPDGSKNWVSVTKVPLRSSGGGITGIVGIARDITELKSAQDDLAKARDAAVEMARVKSEFLANMSHEIRTPLNAITGMTDLLLDTSLQAEQREFAEIILHSAEHLLGVINDILDISKIEARKLQLEQVDFELREVIEAAADLLAVRAQGKGVELVTWIDPDVPSALRGDPSRLRQVLVNLLGNAVKFTERGEVLLRVTATEVTPEQAAIRISVRDTGIGIEPAALTRIFAAFTQADGSTSRKYGGTGLGLAISREMIELMGGRIEVESTPNQGSTFFFTIPLPRQSGGGRAGLTAPVELQGRTVLVVAGNASQRDALQHHLEHAGLRCRTAVGASDAVTLWEAELSTLQPPPLVLIDTLLPDASGLDLARAWRQDPATADMQIALMTPFGSRLDAATMLSSGVAACLIKPIKLERLLETLWQTTGVATRHPAGPESTTASPQSTRLENLRVLLAEDNPVNQNVAQRLLRKLGCAAVCAADGREALAKLQQDKFDVVLMDCQMPELDGFSASRRVRELERDSPGTIQGSPYIVALTANALAGDRERCLQAGMNDYLTKPLRLPELEAALGRACRQGNRGNTTGNPSPGAPSPGAPEIPAGGSAKVPDLEVLDRSVLDGLRDIGGPEQPDPVGELVTLFIEDTTRRINALVEAAAAKNLAGVLAQAHSVKGSAGNLGARRLADAARLLEVHGTAGSWADISTVLPLVEQEYERVCAALRAETASALRPTTPGEPSPD